MPRWMLLLFATRFASSPPDLNYIISYRVKLLHNTVAWTFYFSYSSIFHAAILVNTFHSYVIYSPFNLVI